MCYFWSCFSHCSPLLKTFLPTPLAVCFRISKKSRSEAQEGGKWGHAPWSAGLEDASTHFIQTFKKLVFQQKFRPKYA